MNEIFARHIAKSLHDTRIMNATRPQMPARQQQCDLPMYRRQTEHFLDCIETGKNTKVSGTEALRALRLAYNVIREAEI